jgi:hypothetical protein
LDDPLKEASQMENLIYWHGVAVGIDCGSYISWFPSAPKDAIANLTAGRADPALEAALRETERV